MNKKINVKVKNLRTDKRFSVSMALIAALAILAIGSTSTNLAMAHHDHHHQTRWSGARSANRAAADPL
jgi:hypothetical protein